MHTNFQDLKDFMDSAIPKIGVSGIDCIIYQDHQEIFRHAAGYSDIENQVPMQPNGLYNLYSASKVVTCVAAMQLIEKGKIALFEPIHKYLPEFEKMLVKTGTFVILPAQKPIRILDLFTMSAGISYELDTPEMRKLFAEKGRDFDTRDFVRALAREPLMFEPGEGWNYSYCHDVLGAVIEAASGMTFGEYLKKNIFDPLGMKDTGFALTAENEHRLQPQYDFNYATRKATRIPSASIGKAGDRHESGGGGLISSCEDYILFADAMACGGVGKNGARILSENSIRLMRKNQLRGNSLKDYRKMVPNEGVGYGLGVSVMIDPAIACSLAPADSFSWGGMGGVQNYFDCENKLSYFVAQHTLKSPKEYLEPYMRTIMYAAVSKPFC